MKFIKKLNLYLYDKIKKVKLITVKKIMTKNHSNNITKNISGKGFIIHSQYDPWYQAKFIAKNVFENKPDIVFLFGLGLGYELKEMIKLNSNIRYFIVEPDEEIFKLLLEIEDIKYLFNKVNVHFILGNSSEKIGKFYNDAIGFEKSVNVKFVVLPFYQNIYGDVINNTFKNIKEKINIFRVNINTEIVSYSQWFQNYIGNLKYVDNMCPVTELKENFINKPAVVVSAGPSLDYNIEMLEKLQGKVLIASAGSGINILENKKIKADIACMLDGWINEVRLVKNIKLNRDTAVFYSSVLYYDVLDHLQGPKFLLNVNNMDSEIYNSVGKIPFNLFSGPSVANSLAYNLSELGCNPIIFLGQDLCYSSDRNYASGSIYEANVSEEIKKKGYVKTKNKNNVDVYTTPVFLSMRTSMEACIKAYPNIRYLNGTRDGLDIEGAENIDFNEYAEKNLKDKYEINIDDVYSNFINNEINAKKLENMKKNLKYENMKLIDVLKTSIKYIESEVDQKKIHKNIKESYKKLSDLGLYKHIIEPALENLDFLYRNKNYIEKNKQKFAYILDKCLIMDNAFTNIVKGGK
ncbi:MAG: DUF115 domain-containing protein [Clostridium sp.]|nr:6-hydroxymethylpterin diphosphokinase MptE-like protein [Clostridium sp.]MCH3964322.1 DUF115 domain-containing protein [Clostridium sp.]